MQMNSVDETMVKEITRLGLRASVLLRGVMLQKVDQETLKWGLEELSAGKLLDLYFSTLVQREECVHLLNILHLVYSMEGQLDFQIAEYGMDSLKDDLQEINFSLQQVAERFQLQNCVPAV